MLIINRKHMSPDYYDFVAGHSVDNKVVFQRENDRWLDCKKHDEIPECYPIFSEDRTKVVVPRIHLVGGYGVSSIAVYHKDAHFEQVDEIFDPKGFKEFAEKHSWSALNRSWWRKDEMIRVLEFNGADKREFCKKHNIVTASTCWHETTELCLMDALTRSYLTSKHDRLQQDGRLRYIWVNHSDFKLTFVPSVLTPIEAYTRIYNFIIEMNDPVLTEIGNSSKIVKAGFDTKRSFRPAMKD